LRGSLIISHIIGGLGNQMFQYAAGRALSLKRGDQFRLDVSDFSGYSLHQGFELQRVFGCAVETATPAEVHRVLGWQLPSGIRRGLSRLGVTAFRSNSSIAEPYFHYWPEINNVPQDCYLVGYWQSEKYFKDVTSVIRSDFTFKEPLVKQNAAVAKQINQVNAVSLHVRRGDYASNSRTTATHGLCSLEYYSNAIKYVAERIEEPVFFIFSDDVEWVKENLKMKLPCRYVEHNQGMDSYNDMHLMSLCQHHIIANSSFSWWGAWLNPNQDKLVVAPKRWFVNDSNVEDLFLQGWVSL
jgi:hypothetical protein